MPAQAQRQQEQEPAITKAPSNLPFLGTAPPPFLLPLTLRRGSYLPVPFSFRLLGSQLRTCQVVVRLLGAWLSYHTADFLSSFRGGGCVGAVRFFSLQLSSTGVSPFSWPGSQRPPTQPSPFRDMSRGISYRLLLQHASGQSMPKDPHGHYHRLNPYISASSCALRYSSFSRSASEVSPSHSAVSCATFSLSEEYSRFTATTFWESS